MKQLLLFCNLIFLTALNGFTQPPVGNYVSATLKPGSAANSIYITFKSNVTLTGAKISNFQFELGIPDSIIPKPSFSITSLDPLVVYYSDGGIETQNGVKYYGYGFSGIGSQSGSGTTYQQGVEYNYAEVFFANAPPDIISKVRMMQLPNGGTTTNVNFYISNKGADVTNQPAQFYSSDPLSVSNDGNGYTGSSWVMIPMGVLPVKLSDFTASEKNEDALLNWSVENQDAQSSHFEIERSYDGTKFENIGTVNLTSNQNTHYSYTDNNITSPVSNLNRVVYYRLKMIDKNGLFTYSDIKTIRLNGKGFSIAMYPNPIKNVSKLSLDLDKARIVKVTIKDALGQQVRRLEFNGQKGLNQKDIDLSGLSSGSYMIRVQADSRIKTIPVIKD